MLPLYGASDAQVTITPDGSGPYKTIQYAIDHAPYPSGRLTIEIPPGTYRVRVMIPQDRPRVTFLGHDAATTKITFDLAGPEVGGDFFSPTVDVQGTEFEAYNITFENMHGPKGQGFAIAVHSDRAVFRKCRFTGWNDTLYAAWGRQYYDDCFVEGFGDFIFGNAAAVFDRCEIHSRGPGHVTAHSRNAADQPTGYVFDHCQITGGEGVSKVNLGRPWRSYARVVFLDCWIGPHILPEGWDNWQKPDAEKTAWFGEYRSAGPGADSSKRVPWAHVLTLREAEQFRPNKFLRGEDGWQPAKKESRGAAEPRH
jgi:pectinesterase